MRIPSILLLLTFAACSSQALSIEHAPAATNAQGHEEWRLMHWRDEHGNLPNSADWIAARTAAKANAAHWDMVDDLARTDWIERGPDNVGGRTRALVIHPDKPWRMWAGSAGGGVWQSDTYGKNWEPLDEFMGNLAIGCLALDPSDPDVIFAGTGEGFCNVDAIRGEGIWRSNNGGASWSLMAGTGNFGNVNRIAVAPTNSSIILAATSTGLQRTSNGGASWAPVLSGACQQVLFDPNNPTNCIAPVSTGPGNQRRVQRSTNSGASWTPPVNGTFSGRVELAYAANTPGLVLASAAAGSGQLWRSTNGGANWSQLAATGLTGMAAQGCYNNCIWADPANSNHILIGFIVVYRSTNGGLSFTEVTGTTQGYDIDQVHPDIHLLVADPRYDGINNKTVYVCTDGGIFGTTDITTVTPTTGWTDRENSYRTYQIYGIAGHGSGRLLAGSQDNGTAMVDFGSQRGTRIGGGDGGPCAIIPEDPDTFIFTTQNLNVWRRTATQQGSTNIRNFVDTGLFISPLEIDPNVTDRVYAGGTRLWRTNNVRAATPTWSAVSSALSGSSPPNISAIAIAPTDSKIVWIGFSNGAIFRTADITAQTVSWTSIGGTLPNRIITHIEISHANTTHAVVTHGGFVAGNVQRTTNNGVLFSSITGSAPTGIPNVPVRAVAQHPVLADTWYVATEVGVFESADNGATWSTQHVGPADVSCDDIDFIPGTTTLMLGTHGRGMWTAEVPAPGAVRFGSGCAGTWGTPAMNVPNPPRVGQTMTIQSTNWFPATPIWLVQGSSRHEWFGNALPYDLAPLGAPGCQLYIRPDVIREFQATGTLPGTFTAQMPIANNSALIGTQFFLQLFGVDITANGWGRTASDAFQLTIGQ